VKRLLIVADQSLVVHSIRLALRQTVGFTVVGCVDGRLPTAAATRRLRPDVIVFDDMQESEHALERLREAAEQAPEARRVLFALRDDAEWLDQVFEAGADAVISKSVQLVSLGTLLRQVVNDQVIHRPRPTLSGAASCPLTDRELEVLRLVAEGHTNGQIARALWVTEPTVKFHLSNTYRKLGVANRTEASRYAHVHDLMAERRARLAS
jgi:DNA-binding NarL/FixJ family response regulator